VGDLKKNTPKEVSAYGSQPWVKFSRPCGTASERWLRENALTTPSSAKRVRGLRCAHLNPRPFEDV
jgi:hypothetical protein